MREGDSVKTGALRMLLASLSEKQREKRTSAWKANQNAAEEELEAKSVLSDEEMQSVVMSEVKKRKEAAAEFDKGGRKDLSEKELQEAGILQKYLPPQLSDDEIRTIIKEVIKEVGAVGAQDKGKLMAALMPRVRGKAEGSRVNAIVQELLS